MPTYDYRCDACDHEFEAFQSMSAGPLRKCPECGKQKLKRLIGTGAGIIFKGSGFYETDYRSDSYKKSADADKKSSTETRADSKTDTHSDTKVSKKAETKSTDNGKDKNKGTGKASDSKNAV